jgi:hypothetical protein
VIAKLEQQLELLTQPRQMELVARRAKALAHELERVQRYKAEDDERIGINTETTKKVSITCVCSTIIIVINFYYY